jgi:chemotaxis protein methyltransferase CheR
MTDLNPKPESALSGFDLQRLCDFLYHRTGMLFGESKRYYIDRRVNDHMAAAGLTDFADYFAYLRHDRGEAERLINSFTVNETYFYREEHQLKCLGDDLLPEVVANLAPGDKVRIWSAPCSTGEEAYSIAIWLLENWRMVDAYNIEIVGSDIDTRVLERAREGLYGERALSRLPDAVRETYFEPQQPDGSRAILHDLQESVTFTPANLIDADSMAANGQFDVIFCRNMLIYFDDESRLTAVHNLHQQLNPGGFICLGHTESMSRISDRFKTRRFKDAIVYQRPRRRRP